jgi:hypothetical protein
MAVSAPRRAAAAPAPARTAPPEPKKRPRDRPKPGGPTRKAGVAAPARPAPKRKPARKGLGRKASAATAPARKAPARRKAARASAAAAPARKAPARRAPSRAPSRKSPGRRAAQGGQLIPIAVGRTAATVRALPDSGPIVRLTRGRSWIALLGVLLVGIVALNVVTLSFAASAGRIDANATALEKENSGLFGRKETKYSQERIRHEAAKYGLSTSAMQNPHLVVAGKDDVATAAARLAAASPE